MEKLTALVLLFTSGLPLAQGAQRCSNLRVVTVFGAAQGLAFPLDLMEIRCNRIAGLGIYSGSRAFDEGFTQH